MKQCVIAAVLLLAGCASGGKAPELTQYLLRSDSQALSEGVAVVGLRTVSVATYLDQPGLVLETDTGTVRPATYHQWAEPLSESLRSFLADEISAQSGEPVRHRSYGDSSWKRTIRQLIDIHIDELHGTANGSARLVASWTLTDREQPASAMEHKFAATERLSGDGYASLVAAEKRLLTRLAAKIAEEMKNDK